MATPAVGAGALDDTGQIRVLRMPDTWEVTAGDNSIYFDQGSSSIEADAAELLSRHAARLRAMPGLQITLIAHTTDLGSSSLELARGQERLEAVRKRLEELKVPPGRIRTENHGSERRNAQTCDDDICLSRNRRVDILVHQ
jgi:outer membrane protein OmpA-like peptidoglycan-associated protein